MDGLSAAASVIAVVELSVKITKTLYQYSNAVKDAKSEIERLSREMKTLDSTLEGARKLFDGPHAERLETSQSLRFGLEGCLSQLKVVDERLSDMVTTKASGTPDRFRDRLRLKFRALKWPFQSKEFESIITALEKHRFDLIAALQVDQTYIFRMAQDYVLSKLPNVKDAAFNSYVNEHNARCHPKTRITLLEDIFAWVDDLEGQSIFWLNGMAGTGKSTIARTIAYSLFSEGNQSGASFFFKRGEKDRENAANLFPTIASQLATKDPRFAECLQIAIGDDPATGRGLTDQFNQFLVDPLMSMDTNCTEAKRLVLIMDALDECDRDDDIKLIIHLMSRLKRSKNISLKVFLTSRPELPIRLGFNAIHGKYKDIALHQIPESIIFDDIASFLNTELARIRSDYNSLTENEKLRDDWPGPDVIQDLCKMAVPLFIFAATVCRFIGDPAWANPSRQLEKVLMYQSDNPELDRLDATYLPVLDHLVTKSGAAQRSLLDEFQTVVGSIVILAEPLSPLSLSSLLGIDKPIIDSRLRALHSVLSVPVSDEDSPIRMLHLSFRDFLVDPEKRDTHPFWVDEKLTHRRLYECSIKLLSSSLEQNICDLELQGTHYEDMPPSIIGLKLPHHVQYACVHWVHHLVESGDSLNEDHQAYQFLQIHLLHWLESLSVLGKIHRAISMIRKLRDHTMSSGDKCVTAFLYDASRFCLSLNTVGFFPLQLYSSAMIFSPHQSLVRKKFQSSMWKGILQAPQVQVEWDSCLQRLEDDSGSILDIVISPDGQQLLTASRDDGTVVIRVWDTETGAKLREHRVYTAHDSINAVLSPCGQRVAIFDEYSVQFLVNNVVTGERIIGYTWDFKVRQIIFSHDGCVILVLSLAGSNALVVNLRTMEKTKLSHDTLSFENSWFRPAVLSQDQDSMAAIRTNEVWIWNLKTGKSSFVFKTQSDAFLSDVTFTAVGNSIAAIDDDGMLYVWDLHSAKMKFKSQLDVNQQDPGYLNLLSVTCLKDRKQIISADRRNEKFQFWDSETGELQKVFIDERFNLGQRKFAFSSDGSRIATTDTFSENSTLIRICNTDVHEANNSPAKRISQVDIRFMAFPSECDTLVTISRDSEDNKLVHERLSPSGRGTRQKLEYPLSTGHWIYAISSDGLTMAVSSSSTDEASLWLWNTNTAYGQEMPLRHHEPITVITFSPDNKLIATASNDGSLRLWDVDSSREIQGLNIDFKTPKESIHLKIGFSPDSKTVIISECNLKLIPSQLHVWNVLVATGSVKIVRPPDGIAFTFSAVIAVGSSEKIALISEDGQLVLWEAVDSNLGDVDQFQIIPLSMATGDSISDMSFTSDNRYLKTNVGWISILPNSEEGHIAPFLLDGDWLYRGGHKILWIPPDHRTNFMAWHENTVALQSWKTGCAIFIVFNAEFL